MAKPRITQTTPYNSPGKAAKNLHEIPTKLPPNLPTKFEVPNFTRYGNMKGVAKCRKLGGLGRLGVTHDH